MSTNSEMTSSKSGHMLEQNLENTVEDSIIPLNSPELENISPLYLSEENNQDIYMNENVNIDCNFKEQYKIDSENLDSALDSESNESDTTTSTTDHRFSETITYQQKIIEQNAEIVKNLEEKYTHSEQTRQQLLSRLEQVKI